MKKHLILISLTLICCLFLTSCDKKMTFAIENTETILVMSGTTGKSIEITDKDIIQQITDNINSLSFERGSRINSSGWGYNIRWYNAAGDEIENMSTGGTGTNLFYDGYNWSIVSGNIDTELLDEVLAE